MLEELDGTNTIQVSYVYGDDLLCQRRGGADSFYLYDGLGSTRSLADGAGAETDSYVYTAFGELEASSGSTANSYLFTGEQFDPNLGFYYLRARYMNPAVGRFHSMDTFAGVDADPITLHKYLYGNGAPVDFVDPSGKLGLVSISVGIVGGTIVGLGAQTVVAGIFNTFLNEDGRPTHYYETDQIRICTPSPTCTIESVYNVLLQMPAPRHINPNLGEAVTDGQLGYAGWAIFPGGPVVFNRFDSEFKIVNQTTKFHVLHNGTISRTVEYGSGGITIKTVGEGDNHTAFIALLNEKVGKRAFESLDRQTRAVFE